MVSNEEIFHRRSGRHNEIQECVTKGKMPLQFCALFFFFFWLRVKLVHEFVVGFFPSPIFFFFCRWSGFWNVRDYSVGVEGRGQRTDVVQHLRKACEGVCSLNIVSSRIYNVQSDVGLRSQKFSHIVYCCICWAHNLRQWGSFVV